MFGSLGKIAVASALVGITVIGIVTVISEGLRESRWKKNMGWLPNKSTFIYELQAGKPSEAFNFDGSCYRVRAYPHGNDITTLHHEYGSWRKLTRSCYTNVCKHRAFQLAEDGFLFLERASSRSSICKKYTSFNNGWGENEMPRTGKFKQQFEAAKKKEVARQNKFNARVKVLQSTLDKYRERLMMVREFTVPKKRDCFIDNKDGKARWPRRVKRGDQWIYHGGGGVEIIVAAYFNAHGKSCTDALKELRQAGLIKMSDYRGTDGVHSWSEKPRMTLNKNRKWVPYATTIARGKKPTRRQRVSKLNKFGWPTSASNEKPKKWYQKEKYDLGSYKPKPERKVRSHETHSSPILRYDRVVRERKKQDTKLLSRAERRAKLVRIMSEGRTMRGAALDYGSKTWPFRIEGTRVFANNKKYVGIMIFENLESTHTISGPITDWGLKIKGDDYIVKGEAKLDCRYTLSFVSDNRLEGNWHSCNLSSGGPAYLNLE